MVIILDSLKPEKMVGVFLIQMLLPWTHNDYDSFFNILLKYSNIMVTRSQV
jgi:hypothetical protein